MFIIVQNTIQRKTATIRGKKTTATTYNKLLLVEKRQKKTKKSKQTHNIRV